MIFVDIAIIILVKIFKLGNYILYELFLLIGGKYTQNSLGWKGLLLVTIIIFIISGVRPSIGGTFVGIHYSKDNNILYVGGDGSGNYSSIQDAIDAAFSGDTIYVYDNLSPYIENIIIDKSITLIGEDRDTTVIDGVNLGNVVTVDCNCVIVSGFTIQNSGEHDGGIDISSNNSIICDNIILKNGIGIDIRYSFNNTISNNEIILNNKDGIYLYNSNSNNITGNILFSNNRTGILLRGSSFNTLSRNVIDSNKYLGIYITVSIIASTLVKLHSQFNIIRGNHITSNNGVGIYLLDSGFNTIIKNNFINNELNAFVKNEIFHRNRWRQNYWDKSRILPKLISRVIFISGSGIPPNFIIYIKWISIDWCPAQEKYDVNLL